MLTQPHTNLTPDLLINHRITLAPALHQVPGLYILHDEHDNPIYAGRTTNLLTRLRAHCTNRLEDKWHHASAFPAATTDNLPFLEAFTIHLLQPPENRRTPRLPAARAKPDDAPDTLAPTPPDPAPHYHATSNNRSREQPTVIRRHPFVASAAAILASLAAAACSALHAPATASATATDTTGDTDTDAPSAATTSPPVSLREITRRQIHAIVDAAANGHPAPDLYLSPDARKWLDRHAESVTNVTPAPFPQPEWGRITARHTPHPEGPGTTDLYLHVFEWPDTDRLVIPAIGNDPLEAYFMDPGEGYYAKFEPELVVTEGSGARPSVGARPTVEAVERSYMEDMKAIAERFDLEGLPPPFFSGNRLVAPVERNGENLAVRIMPDPPHIHDTVIRMRVNDSPIAYITPEIHAPADSFAREMMVTCSPVVHGVDIRYTLDGSEPDVNSRWYRWPIRLATTDADHESFTVRARAFHGDNPVGAVATRTFTLIEPMRSTKSVVPEQRGLRLEVYYRKFDVLPNFNAYAPDETLVANVITTDRLENPETPVARRYSGYFRVPRTDHYTFWLTSADGARLLIDDQLIVDNDTPHPRQTRSARANLEHGFHAITIEWFHNPDKGGPDPFLELEWAPPNDPRGPLLAETLRH